jgi:hypothetical protein
MTDELKRNLDGLKLEGLERPFFIGFDVRDFERLQVHATLGAVVRSELRPIRDHTTRVLVGSYASNDENFLDMGGMLGRARMHGNSSLPLEDDYQGIRRALWIATDAVYKGAAETYERKQAALAQQTREVEDEELADFSRMKPRTVKLPPRTFEIDEADWQKVATDLSAVFRNEPEIYASGVWVTVARGMAHVANSEGSQIVQPVSYVGVFASASTQATDGAPLSDAIAFHGLVPGDLPPARVMHAAIKEMAGRLTALRAAPTLEGTYSGPVLFEDQAAAELISQRLFAGVSGLLAYRRPVVSNARAAGFLSRMEGETLLDRLGKRILPRDVSVKVQPHRAEALGKRLVGAMKVDADGVEPPAEIVLVEDGILKTMLNNRTPTKVSQRSSGHQRYVVGRGGIAGDALGPSVVELTSSKAKPLAELRQRLIELAEEEGLEYALVVKRLASAADGAHGSNGHSSGDGVPLPEPVAIYRLWLKTGNEELIRSATLGGLAVSALRHIEGFAKEAQVYNTLSSGRSTEGLFQGAGPGSGIPASFILPRGLLLEELEVNEVKRDFAPTLPVVPSPLAGK